MRVFLSHSSKDKNPYVDYIKEHLSSDEVVIDERSFKRGKKSRDEMVRLISECDLFVFFVSENSLASDDVQFELNEFSKLPEIKTRLCLPIIIDSAIKYSDRRIPKWLSAFNLRHVQRPTKALASILEEIKILTWDKYAFLKKRDNIFRGRNEYIDKFELRYSDRKLGKPIAYSASGFDKIGRSSFLGFCLKKVSKVRSAYEFLSFRLTQLDSIEDFIFRMNELGVGPEVDVSNLIDKTMSEKVEIAATILSSYHENDDVVLIFDDGCIILGNGDISQWFKGILDALNGNIVGSRLIIASKFSYNKTPINKFWNVSLSALSPNERRWLLEDYLSLLGIYLVDEEFEICLNWLQGYPQQVFYLAESLHERGFQETKEDSKTIVDYSLRKVETILSNYLSDPKKMSFLATLAELELSKVDDIIKAFGGDVFYKNFLTELLILSVCTSEGVSREYVRLSEVVRDYVDRKRINADKEAIRSLQEEVKKNFSKNTHGIPDSSDLYFAIKNRIKNSEDIESKYIFPSHFARCMQEIYNRREGDATVIKIALLLISKSATIDDYILHSAYYYYCLANARNKNRDLFKHIDKLKPSDGLFIKGFYYRKIGRWLEAINAFTESLQHNPDNKRAKSELVSALNRVNEFGKAYALAKACYDEDPANLYYAQEYFKCLLYGYSNSNSEFDKKTMEDIISSQNPGDNVRDKSILTCMKANFEFFVNGSSENAY